MTRDILYNELSTISSLRVHRENAADIVLNHLELIPDLLDFMFQTDNKISIKAAWVLEFVCKEELNVIIPYLDTFTKHIGMVYFDSAVRPVVKICELLITEHYSKKDNTFKTALTALHKERITETCFDVMISDHKIAPKAYSMQALFLLGTEIDWIYPELTTILQRDFHIQSAGFKARAKRILKQIQLSNSS